MSEELALLGGPKAVTSSRRCESWPPIDQSDRQALQDVLTRMENGANIWGLFDEDILGLQKSWEELSASTRTIYTNSGTSALHMAVAASGAGPGSEIIVPSFSFVASATCVLHHNAVPVFADIDPLTGLISPEDAARLITPRTKAIIAVHIHGMPADMDALRELARPHNIKLIEDACQAPGALYKGRRVGSLGDMAAFSFNGCKQVAAAEGGMFTTSDELLYERANRLRTFGESIVAGQERAYDSLTLGWMYRSTGLTAALARSQLAKFEDMMAVRRANCAVLDECVRDIAGVRLPRTAYDILSARYNYPLVLDSGLEGPQAGRYRDKVVEALRAEGVPACVWQRKLLCAQKVVQDGVGYGLGCPWRCPHAAAPLQGQTWASGTRYIENYFALDDFQRPAISLRDGQELMRQYAAALTKVMAHRQKLLELCA